MKRRNLIYDVCKSKEIDKYIRILSEDNEDPDIWLGLVERIDILEEYYERKKGNIENRRKQQNNNNSNSRAETGDVSNVISKIIVPAVATVVVSSLGFLPGLDVFDSLNILNKKRVNIVQSIISEVNEDDAMDFVFNGRILDSIQTAEIDNFAVTRQDNNVYVDSHTIAPGTSGEFIIEIDATRNRNASCL